MAELAAMDFDAAVALLETAPAVPYFQPIVATDTSLVFGHESLGRALVPTADGTTEAVSLAPLFEGLREPPSREQYKLILDRELRRMAMAKAHSDGGDSKLFLNISPRLMLSHAETPGTDSPYTLRLARELGLDPSRLVIEITEEAIPADTERLLSVIRRYRQEGCLIALDDVGSVCSNLDRIGLFRPDILKIDYRLLKHSVKGEYVAFSDILDSLAVLAERIGSDLLFEGVETSDGYLNALAYGARYAQGWLFAPALPNFSAPDAFADIVVRHRELHYWQRLGAMIRRRRQESALVEAVGREGMADIDLCGPEAARALEGPAAALAAAAAETGHRLMRIYQTNLEGTQTTPNYNFASGSGRWTSGCDRSAEGRCWCFRPYFFDHVTKAHEAPNAWTVSAPYRDISSRFLVRTLGKRLDSEQIRFIDFEIMA